MASRVQIAHKKGLINPPKFLPSNIHYETIMGSVAYGVSNDHSDEDIYGFCIPPKHIVFPHHAGVIYGFDDNFERFDQYQQHHVEDKNARKEYDFTIFNIVKYFKLCAGANPNMIDSLYTSRRCVLHSTQIGEMVRENRDVFLSKKAWHPFKGYSFAQMHKMDIKNPNPDSKRYESIKQIGYDVKYAYHIVRLLDEVEQILTEGTLDLQKNREQLKSIRRGEWKKEDIVKYFGEKEKSLEKVYNECKIIPNKPDMRSIKQLLINCLEQHYGSLDNMIKKDDSVYISTLSQINDLTNKILF